MCPSDGSSCAQQSSPACLTFPPPRPALCPRSDIPHRPKSMHGAGHVRRTLGCVLTAGPLDVTPVNSASSARPPSTAGSRSVSSAHHRSRLSHRRVKGWTAWLVLEARGLSVRTYYSLSLLHSPSPFAHPRALPLCQQDGRPYPSMDPAPNVLSTLGLVCQQPQPRELRSPGL